MRRIHSHILTFSHSHISTFSHFHILALLVLLASSCDVLSPPFTENPAGQDTTIANPSNVLVLEFTGHTCKSCPRAHRALHDLEALYPGRIKAVSFHLGYFATPQSGDKYSTDFRTPEGSTLENYYPFISFPVGAVQSFDSEVLSGYHAWPGFAAPVIATRAPVSIYLSTAFNVASSEAEVTVEMTALQHLERPVHLAIYLTENNITAWQKDEDATPMDVPDYVHQHVFRTSFSTVWGELVNGGALLEKGSTFTMTYAKPLNENWVASDCEVIAFVYSSATFEVLQVVSAPLTGVYE